MTPESQMHVAASEGEDLTNYDLLVYRRTQPGRVQAKVFPYTDGKAPVRKTKKETHVTSKKAEGSPTTVQDTPMTSPEPLITWTQHTFKKVGLALALVQGERYYEKGDQNQGYVVQYHRPFQIRVLYGEQETLETWRERVSEAGVQFDAEEAIALCGKPARGQVASIPKTGYEVFTICGAEWVQKPAYTYVAVQLEHRGRRLLVQWNIKTDERAAYADAEAHFFASLRCL